MWTLYRLGRVLCPTSTKGTWQSTLPSPFIWFHRLLCQVYFELVWQSTLPSLLYMFHRVTMQCSLITLPSLFQVVHRVLCQVCFPLLQQSALLSLFSNTLAECSVKPVSVGTQSTLPSLLYMFHRVTMQCSLITLSSLFQVVHRVLCQVCFPLLWQSTLSCLFSNTMADCCILRLTYHSVKPVLGSTQSTLSSLFSITVAECSVKPVF